MNIKEIRNADDLYDAQFWIRKFREAANDLESEGSPSDIHPKIVTAQIESLRSLADEMQAEVDKFIGKEEDSGESGPVSTPDS